MWADAVATPPVAAVLASGTALEQRIMRVTGLPAFELARTLRAQGMVLRRHKHKAAARASLEQALGIFERLGAPLWAEATSAELGRVGLRPAAPVDVRGITAAEARVAELVAAGRSNREVAGELFMSPKTVEAHLSRIYRKLGVRSRTELAHTLARQSG